MGRRSDDICKMTILYVDDDPDISQMVCGMLKRNYPTQEIVHAENGPDALMKMRRYNPDLFIIDLYMPFVDGVQLAEEILDRDKEHPVVFLSVCNDDETIRRCLKAGAVYYMTKPIDFDALFYKLDELMIELFLKRFNQAKPTLTGAPSSVLT